MTTADFAALLTRVAQNEGYRQHLYTDTTGNVSGGYGHNYTAKGVSQPIAHAMLEDDLDEAVTALDEQFPIVATLGSTRQQVLAEMCYNLGPDGLGKFTKMWAAIGIGDFIAAANEMLASEWATQVGARATRLAAAMASDHFP